MRHFVTGLEMAVTSSAVPFGFTITIWCTGAFLISSQSTPTTGDVVLFAGGSVLGYALLRIPVVAVESRSTMQIGESPHWVRAGIIHVAAIAAALAAAALLAQADTGTTWAMAPFASVALYVAVSSLEMALLSAERRGEAQG